MHTSSIMIETDIHAYCTRTIMQTNIEQVGKARQKENEIKGIRRVQASDRDEINSFAYKCLAFVTIVEKKTGRNFFVAFHELVYM